LHSNAASGTVQVTPSVHVRLGQTTPLSAQAATLTAGADEAVTFTWRTPSSLSKQLIIDVEVSVNGGVYGTIENAFKDIAVVNKMTSEETQTARQLAEGCGTSALRSCLLSPVDMLVGAI